MRITAHKAAFSCPCCSLTPAPPPRPPPPPLRLCARAANFRVLVLRKGGAVVAAAAVRAHGSLLAEVPYVATRQDYRREGNCRRLMRALEGLLHGVGVRWVALPAVEATAGMWTRSFGFAAAG